MAKGDSSGLLSKVARFVRNPMRDWAELDRKEPEPEPDNNGYSREALKEMIERKRQNDFVRKREFDHLRQLRRRELQVNPDQADRPSLFQSSIPSNPDERAMTLRKIDEIEAQMSIQWWKGKPDEASDRTSNLPVSPKTPLSSGMPIPAPLAGDDSNFKQTDAAAFRPSSGWMETDGEFYPTQIDQAAIMSAAIPQAQSGAQPVSAPRAASGGAATAGASSADAPLIGAGFSTSTLVAMELGASLTDPDLEEAAIRFANGDDVGAEAALLSALQGNDVRPELAEAWLGTLFDLYRATGRQARFESVAIDFAARFGRSAPAWFSIPDLLGRQAKVPVKAGAPLMARHEPTWSSPAELSLQSLATLLADLKKRVSPAHLDWRAIVSLAPDAAEGLRQLFANWCEQPAQLYFRGHENLERALRTITPSGDKSVSPANWQLRMDALRVMKLQDEFELVALEYCVTFEVSPPPWQDVRCVCELEWLGASRAQTDNGLRDHAGAGWGDSSGQDLEAPPAARVELSGEIVGDAADVLGRLEAGLDGASRLVISCAKLIRVDFSAAGSILNWVIKREEEGCQVQFRDVNRIVAAFFNVIGINEHAKVVPRSS